VRDNLQVMHGQLQVERESISGVDPNEETVRLLQFQRSYQAAARVISTVNQTLDDLLRMVE
jgi:flagellar hook-associated protein 1 FlgK